MASFVHITDERWLRDIRRVGIKPSVWNLTLCYSPPGWPARYVFCAPVLRNFESTFHWMRKLSGPGGLRRGVAVQFRLPDAEPVLVGAYSKEHRVLTAAQAVAAFMYAGQVPRGMQVLVPRSIAPAEITRIRAVPNFIGWRLKEPPLAEIPRPIVQPLTVEERKERARERRRVLLAAEAEQPILWRRYRAVLEANRVGHYATPIAESLSKLDAAKRAAWWRKLERRLDGEAPFESDDP
jgi:hypothetical protein